MCPRFDCQDVSRCLKAATRHRLPIERGKWLKETPSRLSGRPPSSATLTYGDSPGLKTDSVCQIESVLNSGLTPKALSGFVGGRRWPGRGLVGGIISDTAVAFRF